MKKLNPLIVILGPTASGKTAVGISLAKKFNGEIISADSRAVYRGMDIATAKPTEEEQKKIKHHLIDIINPDQDFNVMQFKKMAQGIIDKLHKKGKVPFLVGGTGLYIDAFTKGLDIPNVPPDKKIRADLAQKTDQELIGQLKKLDPKTLDRIDKKNRVRLIRALEVCLKTGKKFSTLRHKKETKFDILQIGLTLNRQQLYQKINKRVDQMIKAGLIDESRQLLEKGYSCNLPSMTGLGYRQFCAYLLGKLNFEEALHLMKRDTRRFARRQLTWFKRDKSIHWVKNSKEAEDLVKDFLRGK